MFLLNRALGWPAARPEGLVSQDLPARDGLSLSLGLDELDDLDSDLTTEELSSDDVT